MPPSREEYLRLIRSGESIGRPHMPSMDTALQMIKTAAVSFEHLTNQPEWDRFLSMVQAQYEGAKRERDLSLSLCGGAVGDALVMSQLAYQHAKGKVDAFEVVLGLPLQVMKTYQDVKK